MDSAMVYQDSGAALHSYNINLDDPAQWQPLYLPANPKQVQSRCMQQRSCVMSFTEPGQRSHCCIRHLMDIMT